MIRSSYRDNQLAFAANHYDDGVFDIFCWRDNDDRYDGLIQIA
jgi:hypothetical protein